MDNNDHLSFHIRTPYSIVNLAHASEIYVPLIPAVNQDGSTAGFVIWALLIGHKDALPLTNPFSRREEALAELDEIARRLGAYNPYVEKTRAIVNA